MDPNLPFESEITLAQRVHIANKKIKSLLNSTYTSLAIGIILFIVVLAISIPSIQFIENLGTYENRLSSPNGPACNIEDYSDPNNIPARIMLMEGELGAEKAGLKDGDIITKIKELQIKNTQDILTWPSKFPEIKPGDIVEVTVIREGQELVFNVQTTASVEDPTKPLLGILTFDESSCIAYFVLNEGKEFSEDSLRLVLSELWSVVSVTIVLGAILILAFFVWMPQIRNLNKEMREWEGQYLDESYLLTFETSVPTGSTDGEKIFNMAQDALPELKKNYIERQKWTGKVKGKDKYEFDCFQITPEKKSRVFIAKHFGDTTIDAEKLKELCKAVEESMKLDSLNKKFKGLKEMEILRVSCFGRKYDPKFFVEKTRDEILDKLDKDFFLDLINEKEEGYTVLSVEY